MFGTTVLPLAGGGLPHDPLPRFPPDRICSLLLFEFTVTYAVHRKTRGANDSYADYVTLAGTMFPVNAKPDQFMPCKCTARAGRHGTLPAARCSVVFHICTLFLLLALPRFGPT
jgi:hypothetical protein